MQAPLTLSGRLSRSPLRIQLTIFYSVSERSRTGAGTRRSAEDVSEITAPRRSTEKDDVVARCGSYRIWRRWRCPTAASVCVCGSFSIPKLSICDRAILPRCSERSRRPDKPHRFCSNSQFQIISHSRPPSSATLFAFGSCSSPENVRSMSERRSCRRRTPNTHRPMQ